MPSPRHPGRRFTPRFTLILLGGFLLFLAVSLLYSLPILLAPVPDGASQDYVAERVRAHLAGKTMIILALSILAVAVATARPWKR